MSFVLIVDRKGAVTWPEDGTGPTALPCICKDGLLAPFFASERPRLREASSAVDEVAAAVLASAWGKEPAEIRSRVALRRRSVYLSALTAIAAALLVVLAVAVYAFEKRGVAERRSYELARALVRVCQLVVADATLSSAAALSDRNVQVSVRELELMKLLEAAPTSDPIRAAAMAALIRQVQTLPRVRGNIGPISTATLVPSGSAVVVRRLDGTVEVYDTQGAPRRIPSPAIGALDSETMRLNYLPSPRGLHGDTPHLSTDERYVALATTQPTSILLHVTWRITVWRIGSAATIVDLPVPYQPLLRWTQGPILLASMWSPEAGASGGMVYGWRFERDEVRPPFQATSNHHRS
jgi:hypothetical protein